MEYKLKVFTSVWVVIMALCNVVLAACTGSSPTWSSTADRASVASCISSAVSGDTINVTAGTATWSTPILIPSSKALIINGAGGNIESGTLGTTGWTLTANDQVILTCSTGTCFDFITGEAQSSASSVGGFRFTGKGVNLSNMDPSKNVRIHHNHFVNTGQTDLEVSCTGNERCSAVLDHNIFDELRVVMRGTNYGASDSLPGRDWQHQIWAVDPGFGDGKAIYIEANRYIDITHPGCADTNYGGSYVFRYNRAEVIAVYCTEFHGMQGDNRTGQRWEVYGNTIVNTGGQIFTAGFMRGGSGVVFNNNLVGLWGSMFDLKVERSCETKPPYGLCDGTHNVDGNTLGGSAAGYPCRDQIGRVKDASAQVGWGETSPWPVQTLWAVASFNNKNSGVEVDSESNAACAAEIAHTVENRDFYNLSTATGSPQTVGVRRGTLANRPAGCTTGVMYWVTDEGEWNSVLSGVDGRLYKCTATNTWSLHYTPYTYPHVLAGGGGFSGTVPEVIRLVK